MTKYKYISLITILLITVMLTGCNDRSASIESKNNSSNPLRTEQVDSESQLEAENEPVPSDLTLENDTETVIEPVIETADEATKEMDVVVQAEVVLDEVLEPNVTTPIESNEKPDEAVVVNDNVSIQVIGLEEISLSSSLLLETEESVFDLLLRACEAEGIRIDYTGKGPLAYIQGIDNIYEFDYGPNSGWLYSVNGDFPAKGMGNYFPEVGDEIIVQYTLDGGYDIGSR